MQAGLTRGLVPAKGVERAGGIATDDHYGAKPRAIQVKLISGLQRCKREIQGLLELDFAAVFAGAPKRSASRLATRALTKCETSPPSCPISFTKRDEMN